MTLNRSLQSERGHASKHRSLNLGSMAHTRVAMGRLPNSAH